MRCDQQVAGQRANTVEVLRKGNAFGVSAEFIVIAGDRRQAVDIGDSDAFLAFAAAPGPACSTAGVAGGGVRVSAMSLPQPDFIGAPKAISPSTGTGFISGMIYLRIWPRQCVRFRRTDARRY